MARKEKKREIKWQKQINLCRWLRRKKHIGEIQYNSPYRKHSKPFFFHEKTKQTNRQTNKQLTSITTGDPCPPADLNINISRICTELERLIIQETKLEGSQNLKTGWNGPVERLWDGQETTQGQYLIWYVNFIGYLLSFFVSWLNWWSSFAQMFIFCL